jgi:energy-coupling factor transporter transmembrane protein EcfT
MQQQQPLNTNNLVNTPMSANQHIPTSSTPTQVGQSPSFSPSQQQRNIGVDDNTSAAMAVASGNASMVSPMVSQAMNNAQQPMISQAHRVQQYNAIVAAAMNTMGLSGRDQQSLSPEERVKSREWKGRVFMLYSLVFADPLLLLLLK